MVGATARGRQSESPELVAEQNKVLLQSFFKIAHNGIILLAFAEKGLSELEGTTKQLLGQAAVARAGGGGGGGDHCSLYIMRLGCLSAGATEAWARVQRDTNLRVAACSEL